MPGLPDPSSPEAPKYWIYEQGGELVPAVTRYLNGEDLSDVLLVIKATVVNPMEIFAGGRLP